MRRDHYYYKSYNDYDYTYDDDYYFQKKKHHTAK